MPNSSAADSAIKLMQEASEANRNDACRQGSIIVLPAEGDLLMTGDLHGHRKNYQKIVEYAALSRNGKRHLILHEIIHSLTQTVDGRDLSFQVFEMAARLKCYFPDQVHFLLGNHDLGDMLMMDIRKGGQSSLKGLDRALAVAYGERKDEVRAAYHGFIASMPLAAETQTGIFISHSIPSVRHLPMFDREKFREELSREELTRESFAYHLVWGRQLSQEASDQFAQLMGADLLISGHQPSKEGYLVPNTRHLILDSKDDEGCYALIPLDRKLTHNQLIESVRRLRNNQRVV